MGDAAVQKMIETKKAYANIMLHAAQEAAARIMNSERRACRIQKEAEYAKEEALRMLLRMKQTMDSKMHEAQILSFKQKKKIKELEEQLQEAKSTARELREELEIVQDELKRTKKGEQSKSLNNKWSDRVARGNEYAETLHNTEPDASGSILETRSNSKFGSNMTFDDKNSTLSERKDEGQSQNTKDSVLMTAVGDVPYLPSILKRTKMPPIYSYKFSQGIHALIGNKLGGTFRSPAEIVGSEKNLIAKSMMLDSPAGNKDSTSGGKKVQDELKTNSVGCNYNVPEKPLHGEQRRHVEYMNRNAPFYEHLPNWDLTRHETTDHCPSKVALNGSSPSEANGTCSKGEAHKVIETSLPAKTCNLKTQPGYVQAKENKAILVKRCSFKNAEGNAKKEANVRGRDGDEAVHSSSAKVGTMDLDYDSIPCNSNAGPDELKSTTGSFPFKTNIIHYTRKRSRQAKENTNSSCDKEDSPERVCLKRKASEGPFNLLPDLNNQASNLKSSKNWESQSIAQVAHQLLALSDKKWFR